MRRRTHDQTLRARPRWSGLLATMLVLSSAVGCGGDSSTAPKNADISGTYALTDVGGNKLPTSIYQGPFVVNGQKMDVRIDVFGSTMELDATHYVLSMAFQVAAQGQALPLVVIDSGTYTKNADVVSFTSPAKKLGRLTGSIENGDLKVSIDLVGDGFPPTYLFRK